MITPLEKSVNELIKTYSSGKNGDFNAQNISDGYHTFNDLYDHRANLFIALVNQFPDQAWRYTKNADGQSFEGYFGLGLFPDSGKQITYHLPVKYLPLVNGLKHFETNPHYDGHTSSDIIYRLASISQKTIPNPQNLDIQLLSTNNQLPNTNFDADAALVKQNQLLSARNRMLDNDIKKLQATIDELEIKLNQHAFAAAHPK